MALIWALPAHAGVRHTVESGETLWSIAAASNLTTRTLAAANGMSETSAVIRGRSSPVPSESEGAAALAAAPGTAPAPAGQPPAAGAYTVRPGDTLSGVAARAGVQARAPWAAMNGLAADAGLISGTALKLPAVSSRTGAAAAPSTAPAAPGAAPHPTPGRLDAAEIGRIAGQNGVPPALAAAIAWQESGFNNGAVSPANARGVMQVMPGTWASGGSRRAGRRLHPSSSALSLDNVNAGTLFLRQLLQDSGGDPAAAIAGYYQGQASVRSIGMLPQTRRYVDNVLALRARFGG